MEYIRQDIVIAAVYFYLRKENIKFLKFQMCNCCYFEKGISLLSAVLQQAPQL